MITSASVSDLAAAILGHLAQTPELLTALAAETGMAPADLRAASGDSAALASALIDFVCASDERLLAFSDASGWPPQQVEHARQAIEAGMVG